MVPASYANAPTPGGRPPLLKLSRSQRRAAAVSTRCLSVLAPVRNRDRSGFKLRHRKRHIRQQLIHRCRRGIVCAHFLHPAFSLNHVPISSLYSRELVFRRGVTPPRNII